MDRDFWNQRYKEHPTVYGEQPNEFFKRMIDGLPIGKLLLPAEGEGRNALYAATHGWDVTCFDMSEEAQQKALKRADELGVNIDYQVKDFRTFTTDEQFDVIALCFFHLPSYERVKFHKRLVPLLKTSGYLILEGFHKNQLGKKSGGPQNIDMLFSLEDIKNDFIEIDMINGEEVERVLDEGPFHQGPASLIDYFAQKP
jgi:hypothetical protein